MDFRPSIFTRRFDRRQLLTATVAAGAAVAFAGRIVVDGATPTATPVAKGTPTSTAAGPPEATPIAGTPSAVSGKVFEASMQSLKFIPPEIDIEAGTTVGWKNEDTVAHTVTHRMKVEDQLFSSPLIAPGDSFSFTFETPGTYAYYCMPHPFMTGAVVVS